MSILAIPKSRQAMTEAFFGHYLSAHTFIEINSKRRWQERASDYPLKHLQESECFTSKLVFFTVTIVGKRTITIYILRPSEFY